LTDKDFQLSSVR